MMIGRVHAKASEGLIIKYSSAVVYCIILVTPVRTFKTSLPKRDVEAAAKYLAAGAAISGMGGAASGIGFVFGGYLQSVARNPGMRNELITSALVGFALAEAMGLMCLGCAFLILFI